MAIRSHARNARHLLLARGVMPESERQLELLLERGLFRKLSVTSTSEAPKEESPEASH